MSGIVYILTNPYMPQLALLGYFDVGTVEKEMQRLYSEGVPDLFECEYAAEVEDAEKAEEEMRENYADAFVSHERGFFKKEFVTKAKAMIEKKKIKDVTPDSHTDENNEDDEEASSREMFDFYKVGIKKGAVINFIKNTTIVCVVHDNRKVEFQGRVKSFSVATREAHRIIHKPTKSEAYAGQQYWNYNKIPLFKLWNDYKNGKNN